MYMNISQSELDSLRQDCAAKQKKGLHFILASVVIWGLIVAVQASSLPILTKNLLVFCCTAPLMPIAFMLSKVIGVDFQNKENPLTKLGILFSLNQLIYLLIPMWLFQAVPDRMLMVFAMIFGAHLLPFSWLYQSKTYLVASIAIPLISLFVGLKYGAMTLSVLMLGLECVLSFCLWMETRRL